MKRYRIVSFDVPRKDDFRNGVIELEEIPEPDPVEETMKWLIPKLLSTPFQELAKKLLAAGLDPKKLREG